MDLRSVRRWGAPPEETDATNGLDVDLIATTPELIDHTLYHPLIAEIQRRRPTVNIEWNGHDSAAATAISNNVACEKTL